MHSRQHPVQGYRSCLGIIRLAKVYSNARLESACARGRKIGARSYTSIASILKNNIDQKTEKEVPKGVNITHENIRGSAYFVQNKGPVSTVN
jgi:transposase